MLRYNYDDLIYDLTPVELRTIAQFEWLRSLVKPLKTLKNDVVIPYYIDSLYEILHTGQTLSLEHLLNDYYNLPFPVGGGHLNPPYVSPSIYVIDAERFWKDELYLFNQGIDAESSLNWNPAFPGTGVNITDPMDGQAYLFNKSEIVATPSHPNEDNDVVALYNMQEFIDDVFDFIILVDRNWLAGDINKVNTIHGFANRYHVAGYTWVIMTYTGGIIQDLPIYKIN